MHQSSLTWISPRLREMKRCVFHHTECHNKTMALWPIPWCWYYDSWIVVYGYIRVFPCLSSSAGTPKPWLSLRRTFNLGNKIGVLRRLLTTCERSGVEDHPWRLILAVVFPRLPRGGSASQIRWSVPAVFGPMSRKVKSKKADFEPHHTAPYWSFFSLCHTMPSPPIMTLRPSHVGTSSRAWASKRMHVLNCLSGLIRRPQPAMAIHGHRSKARKHWK